MGLRMGGMGLRMGRGREWRAEGPQGYGAETTRSQTNVQNKKNVCTSECDPKLIATESRNNRNFLSLKQTKVLSRANRRSGSQTEHV